jgi:hypothetical protein
MAHYRQYTRTSIHPPPLNHRSSKRGRSSRSIASTTFRDPTLSYLNHSQQLYRLISSIALEEISRTIRAAHSVSRESRTVFTQRLTSTRLLDAQISIIVSINHSSDCPLKVSYQGHISHHIADQKFDKTLSERPTIDCRKGLIPRHHDELVFFNSQMVPP